MLEIALIVVIVLLVMALIGRDSAHDMPRAETYRAIANLHSIRRKLDVATLKTQVRDDAARARRDLRDELTAASERQSADS